MKIMSGIILIFIVFFSFQNEKERIKRFNQVSQFNKVQRIVPHKIHFQDNFLNDTLIEYVDINNIPLMYSRKILTGVCVDGECRLVNIVLYWNITGRYMGFELPRGEYLSKTEHEPFKPEEYDRLHELLAEPFSALAHYSIEELVPTKDSANFKIDAVSSATTSAVLDYIVEGAAYTTYTMWHIVYGQTKREIEKLTTENLNSEIAIRLLKSEILDDQVWALNHISDSTNINPELQKILLDYISGKDVYLAERSLIALKPGILANERIQNQLVAIFAYTGFLQKKLIVQRLEEAPQLQPEVVLIFSNELNELNGVLVKNILDLFKIHNIEDEAVAIEVAQLLKNENRYIANQALKYLENLA